jgi:hypothetical protein
VRAPPKPEKYNEGDHLFPLDGMHTADRIIADAYARAGAAEKCQSSWGPGHHQFNETQQQEAFDWMRRWLS